MTNTLLFRDFLFKDKNNRLLLALSAIVIFIELLVFKYYYPFAGFIDGDSYVYLETASKNLGFNSYMVGYGTFLRLFSVFTKSDLALVVFQYLFIEATSLLLLFTLIYFFSTANWAKYFLVAFISVNPLFLYMANYVSSDAYFLSLSFLWFTLLIWIIYRPTIRILVYHSVVIFLCFTVRYNALLYPFIFLIALWFARTNLSLKLFGMALSFLLIGSFVVYTGNKFKELTGYWQYSPFSGWQLANNAIYSYRYVDSKDRKPVPKRLEALDRMVRQYIDTTHNPFTNPELLDKAGTVYMWTPNLTLHKYKNMLFQHDSTITDLKSWSSMGPIYTDYGVNIILKYPKQFLINFAWPNACRYYAPPVEFLGVYNSGENIVHPPAKDWFGYKSSKVFTRTKSLKVGILEYYPLLAGIANVIFFFVGLCLLGLGFFKQKSNRSRIILLMISLWVGNALFTIFASTAALRFQSFPILSITIFSFILIDLMIKTATDQEIQRKNQTLPNYNESIKNEFSL